MNYVFRGLPFETVNDLKGLPGLNVTISLRPPYNAALWINCNDTILSKPLVRQAIAYAINRTEISEKATLGNSPTADYIIDPDLVPPPTGLIHYDRNLTLANQLLDQAGYPRKGDGTRFTIELLTRPEADEQIVAQLVKDQLADVGIAVNIKSVDMSTWLNLQANGQYQIATSKYWLSPLWTYQLFSSSWIGKGPFTNVMFYNNSSVDKLLDDWLSQPDKQKQIEDLQKVELQVNKDLPQIVLYRVAWVNAFSSSFGGSDIPIRGTWYFADTLLDVYYLPVQTASPTSTTSVQTTTSSGQGNISLATIGIGIAGVLIVIAVAIVLSIKRKK